MGAAINDLLGGVSLTELLRKQAKSPLEELLYPDSSAEAIQAMAAPSDFLSISEESLAAANDMLKELNTPKDYADTSLESKRMDAASALDALNAEFDILDYVSEEMRDAVLEARAKGALKKREDVYEASKDNVKEMKEDIDRTAEEAAAPKNADGNPIDMLGTTSEAPTASVEATLPQAQLQSAAAQADLATEQTDTPLPARVVSQLNITV